MAQQLQTLTKAQLIKMVLKQKKKIKSQGAVNGSKTKKIKELQQRNNTLQARADRFKEQVDGNLPKTIKHLQEQLEFQDGSIRLEQKRVQKMQKKYYDEQEKFRQCVEANKAMVEQLIKEQNKVVELEQLNKDIMEQSLKKTQVIKIMQTDVMDSAEQLETVIQEQSKMLEQEKANTELFKHQYQQLAEQQQHYQDKADKELKEQHNKVILLEQQNKHYVSEIELLLKHIPKKTTDGSTQTPTPQVVKCVVKTKTSVGVQAQPPQQGMFKYLVVDDNQDEQVVDMDNFYDDDELMAML